MVKTRSMTRNKNKDVSSRKRMMNTCGSDLNDHVLSLVMMRLAGVVEFISFSGVCKSWRSLALSNRERFMGSQPPMQMWCISYDKTCHLQEFEGRKFKTMIPQLVGRDCVGLSCGYLILFGKKTRDFWLVNPITRHELHFPGVPFDVEKPFDLEQFIRAVLVFSPSLNTWVFFVTKITEYEIWFSIAGKGGAWNHVPSTFNVIDLHAFKGKIYTLNFRGSRAGKYHICEIGLNPEPKLTVVDIRFLDSPSCVFDLVSSDENLYLLYLMSADTYTFRKLEFDKMICAPCEKAKEEYVLFHGYMKSSAAVKPESWAASSSQSQYVRFFDANKKRGKDRFRVAKMWYFPHDCLDVDLIDK